MCDTATKKAINKELWYDQEVDKWRKMDSILREKIDRSVIIMNNYDKLLILSQEQLKASEKQKKKAVAWKNVYKPIAIGSLLYIGLNLLLKRKIKQNQETEIAHAGPTKFCKQINPHRTQDNKKTLIRASD